MDYIQTAKGSFFDPIADALGQTVAIYSQLETIKLNNQLAKAAASAANYNTPTPTQDAQALAGSVSGVSMANPWVIGAAVLLGAAALYVIVK